MQGKEIKRAVFYEINKAAVNKAIAEPRDIAMDLVQSQETRRALDRHFGFSTLASFVAPLPEQQSLCRKSTKPSA